MPRTGHGPLLPRPVCSDQPRNAIGIPSVRLVWPAPNCGLQGTLHLSGFFQDDIQTCRPQPTLQPLRQGTSFKPDCGNGALLFPGPTHQFLRFTGNLRFFHDFAMLADHASSGHHPCRDRSVASSRLRFFVKTAATQDRVVDAKAHEPAEQQVTLQLRHQLPLGADREQGLDQVGPDQAGQRLVDHLTDRAQRMRRRDARLKIDLAEQRPACLIRPAHLHPRHCRTMLTNTGRGPTSSAAG